MKTYPTHLALSDVDHLDDPGYYGTCWFEVREHGPRTDRLVPGLLGHFLHEVARVALAEGLEERVGPAYLRVVDAGRPENYMLWHADCEDGGVRFHAALATDGRPVTLAWPDDPALVGQPVEATCREALWLQPPNGTLCRFTTEPHGVLPQPARPGERTVVLFTTLYRTRAAADLYTTNNTTTPEHVALPQLEVSR